MLNDRAIFCVLAKFTSAAKVPGVRSLDLE
jgi:hypothetical protein